MPISLSDIFGDPNVGIFSFANEQLAILPAGLPEKKLDVYRSSLGVEAFGVGIADSRLVGIYLAGNSNAVLVPYITTKDELKLLKSTGARLAPPRTSFCNFDDAAHRHAPTIRCVGASVKTTGRR